MVPVAQSAAVPTFPCGRESPVVVLALGERGPRLLVS